MLLPHIKVAGQQYNSIPSLVRTVPVIALQDSNSLTCIVQTLYFSLLTRHF